MKNFGIRARGLMQWLTEVGRPSNNLANGKCLGYRAIPLFYIHVTLSPESVLRIKVRWRGGREGCTWKVMSYRHIRSPLASFLLPRLATAVAATSLFSHCFHGFGFKGHHVLHFFSRTMSLLGNQQASFTFLFPPASCPITILGRRSTRALRSLLDRYKSRTDRSSIQASP